MSNTNIIMLFKEPTQNKTVDSWNNNFKKVEYIFGLICLINFMLIIDQEKSDSKNSDQLQKRGTSSWITKPERLWVTVKA